LAVNGQRRDLRVISRQVCQTQFNSCRRPVDGKKRDCFRSICWQKRRAKPAGPVTPSHHNPLKGDFAPRSFNTNWLHCNQLIADATGSIKECRAYPSRVTRKAIFGPNGAPFRSKGPNLSSVPKTRGNSPRRVTDYRESTVREQSVGTIAMPVAPPIKTDASRRNIISTTGGKEESRKSSFAGTLSAAICAACFRSSCSARCRRSAVPVPTGDRNDPSTRRCRCKSSGRGRRSRIDC
jgi:hypothetical protein